MPPYKRLAIFNCKGGVGKTTTTLNLGAALGQTEQPAARLIDLDPQGHLSRIFGYAATRPEKSLFNFFAHATPLNFLEMPVPQSNRTLLASHGYLMKADSLLGKGPSMLQKLREGLNSCDALQARTSIIDCCPYIGVLSLNAIFAADAILIPVATDYLSMQGAQQITRTLTTLEPVLKRRMPRRYLLTRFDRRKRMCLDIRQRMHEEFGDELCQTVIRENVAIATSPLAGTDIFMHQPLSAGATDYRQLCEELVASSIL